MSDKTNLAKKPSVAEARQLACNVCLAEIPESVAMSSEGDEYTQHFCGIECYNRWREETEKEASETTQED
ncbi:MAG TPA: DUF3330 domain-containing protein [Gammaproteobacteria bacterium]|nr:DUF3330 domain-containing protein [Gammaproteobacteria bacterium]